jgi:hypothetical protein
MSPHRRSQYAGGMHRRTSRTIGDLVAAGEAVRDDE